MIARLRHPSARIHTCDVSKPTRDPTGTKDIRRRYRTATDLRWRKFAKLLKTTIITQDMLGLGPEVASALQLSFANLPAEARIRSLQSWTDDMLGRVVLEGDASYLDDMSAKSYNRAVARAMRLTGKRIVPPGASDAIGVLQQLAMTELQGVIEAVSQQIVRLGTNAILEHNTQAATFRAMSDVIEKVGVVRSRAMVELITVKAHGTGSLDQFAAAGVKRVALLPETRPGKKLIGDAKEKPVSPAQARRGTSPSTISRIIAGEKEVEQALSSTERVEVLTAGDDLVCQQCEEIAADGPYDIDEARSLIPAHPNCRCSFVPEGSSLFGIFEFKDNEAWETEERDPSGKFAGGGGSSMLGSNDPKTVMAKMSGLAEKNAREMRAAQTFGTHEADLPNKQGKLRAIAAPANSNSRGSARGGHLRTSFVHIGPSGEGKTLSKAKTEALLTTHLKGK